MSRFDFIFFEIAQLWKCDLLNAKTKGNLGVAQENPRQKVQLTRRHLHVHERLVNCPTGLFVYCRMLMSNEIVHVMFCGFLLNQYQVYKSMCPRCFLEEESSLKTHFSF